MSSLAFNKRASFDYDIQEKIEAGIELKGFEVKTVKATICRLRAVTRLSATMRRGF